MQHRFLLPVLALGLAVACFSLAPTAPAQKADNEKIAKLIEDLGSDEFEERQKAFEQLGKIGAPALEALRKATESKDAEVRKKAKQLVAVIAKDVEGKAILTAKPVHLVYKDTPIKEAVADFVKQTGYLIVLHDPENKLKDKKITLDTGKVGFWAALDKFCEVAELTEGDPNEARLKAPMPGNIPGVAPMPPAGIKRGKAKVAPGGAGNAPQQPEANDNNAAQEEARRADAEKEAAAKKRAEAEAAKARELLLRIQQAQQVQGGPAIMVPPGGGMIGGPPGFQPYVQVQQGQITLIPGKAAKKPVDNSSSVRVRVSDRQLAFPGPGPNAKQFAIQLELTAEPRLRWQQLNSVTISKAIDSNDEKLTQVEEAQPMNPVGPNGVIVFPGGGIAAPGLPGGAMWAPSSNNNLSRFVLVKLNRPAKEAKSLKELTGAVSARFLSETEAAIVAENVMKAEGKTFKGKHGGYIKINSVKKENGLTQIHFEFEMPAELVPETQYASADGNVGGPMAEA